MNQAIVKSVLSGDTVILRGPAVKGPPQEKIVHLANVQAPRLSMNRQPSEPFGFASRDYLRKKLVGKKVLYAVEYTSGKGREFVQLSLDGENVAQSCVRNGWLQVKSGNDAR